jgi:CBS-domain-containing membrane protein
MMKVRDIMTTDPVRVTGDTGLREAARLMVRHRVSGLPVVDGAGKLVGIVSEGDFIRQEASRERPHGVSLLDALFGEGELEPVGAETVGEVMTRSVVTITPEASIGEAARVMGRRNVKRLPVVDLEGELVGIISRADVVGAFTKPDDIIEDEIREDVIRRLLFLDPEVVTIGVSDGVVTLEGELENRTEAHLLEELTRRIAGVVRVESRLGYKVDDRKLERDYPLP